MAVVAVEGDAAPARVAVARRAGGDRERDGHRGGITVGVGGRVGEAAGARGGGVGPAIEDAPGSVEAQPLRERRERVGERAVAAGGGGEGLGEPVAGAGGGSEGERGGGESGAAVGIGVGRDAHVERHAAPVAVFVGDDVADDEVLRVGGGAGEGVQAPAEAEAGDLPAERVGESAVTAGSCGEGGRKRLPDGAVDDEHLEREGGRLVHDLAFRRDEADDHIDCCAFAVAVGRRVPDRVVAGGPRRAGEHPGQGVEVEPLGQRREGVGDGGVAAGRFRQGGREGLADGAGEGGAGAGRE